MTKIAMALLLFLSPCFCWAATAAGTAPCEKHVYAGPDGRLDPNLIARVPKSTEPLVGFEIVHDQPLVARPHQLVALSEKGINEFALKDRVKGISVNQADELLLQTDTGFESVGNSGFQTDRAISGAVRGRLYGSGNKVHVEVRAHQGILQFIARNPNGGAFPLASIKGTLRAASWNDLGLATVVGNSLYVWQAGSKNIVRLLTDEGLATTQDVVLVGSNRAVVALRSTVILVTNETMTVVIGLPQARARFHKDVLFLLDTQTGVIWTIKGLDHLGNKKDDEAYAARLLKQVPKQSPESSAQFLAAARIIGCSGARKQLANPGTVLTLSSSPSTK